jgi:hypothetical protein
MARWDKHKINKFKIDDKDFWGAKRIPSYTSLPSAISDSYHFGRCKTFRDKLRRALKHGMRQFLKMDLKEQLNDTKGKVHKCFCICGYD